mmetsp:Transcript_12906/g.23430  ORF Transcript_12906/g.23430 Transcript_12906/m.23430 type:complete len:358 (-) Transcript_12906:172-1245(-)
MAATHTARDVIKAVGPALRASGFDVLWPTTVGLYNSRVAAKEQTLHPLPTLSAGDDTLALIVGNSREIWPAFTRAYHKSAAIQACPNPLDLGYVTPALSLIFEKLLPKRLPGLGSGSDSGSEIRLVHITEPASSLVGIGRLASESGLAWTCPTSMLSIHPILGPWLSYRALVIVDAKLTNEDQKDLLAAELDITGANATGLWGWIPPTSLDTEQKEALAESSERVFESFKEEMWKWDSKAPAIYGEAAGGRLSGLVARASELSSSSSDAQANSGEKPNPTDLDVTPTSAAWIDLRRGVASEVDEAIASRVCESRGGVGGSPLVTTCSSWEFSVPHLAYHYDKNKDTIPACALPASSS